MATKLRARVFCMGGRHNMKHGCSRGARTTLLSIISLRFSSSRHPSRGSRGSRGFDQVSFAHSLVWFFTLQVFLATVPAAEQCGKSQRYSKVHDMRLRSAAITWPWCGKPDRSEASGVRCMSVVGIVHNVKERKEGTCDDNFRHTSLVFMTSMSTLGRRLWRHPLSIASGG